MSAGAQAMTLCPHCRGAGMCDDGGGYESRQWTCRLCGGARQIPRSRAIELADDGAAKALRGCGHALAPFFVGTPVSIADAVEAALTRKEVPVLVARSKR